MMPVSKFFSPGILVHESQLLEALEDSTHTECSPKELEGRKAIAISYGTYEGEVFRIHQRGIEECQS